MATAPEQVLNTAQTPLQISDYMYRLKAHIAQSPQVWVEGEIIEFKTVRGNSYATIKDMVQEQSMSLKIWRSQAAQMPEGLGVGSRVCTLVKPDMWEKNGQLSLVVRELSLVGLGDLLVRIEQLRKVLAQEGLFAPERKKPLPRLPQMIGLIAGNNSDAERDVIENVHRRWPQAQFRFLPTLVQGVHAPAAVAKSLAELDADPAVDVIVIARGGGALEEVILPFSDEGLIRAVAACNTPVVSAIGHENDRPVLDDVADFRASTPTDAAKHLVPDAGEEMMNLMAARQRMVAALQRGISYHADRVAALRSRPVLSQPQTMITQRAETLVALNNRSQQAVNALVRHHRQQLNHFSQQMRALSPQQTLARGYSVTRTAEGHVVTNPEQAPAQSPLQILLADGALSARSEGPSTVGFLPQITTDHPASGDNSTA